MNTDVALHWKDGATVAPGSFNSEIYSLYRKFTSWKQTKFLITCIFNSPAAPSLRVDAVPLVSCDLQQQRKASTSVLCCSFLPSPVTLWVNVNTHTHMQTHTNTDEILMLSFVTERLFLSPVMFWPPDIVYRNQLVDLNDKWVIDLDGTKMELFRVLAF